MMRLISNRINPWSLIAFGTLLLPVSPYICLTLYTIAALGAIPYWQKALFSEEKIIISLLFGLVSVWMLLRIYSPWGWGLQSIQEPMLYPATVIDYVPFFLFFCVITLRPPSYLELEKLAWCLLFTVLPEFVLAALGKYAKLQGENFLRDNTNIIGNYFTFPGQNLPLIHIPITDLKQLDYARISSGFLNPNILGCYCLFVLSVAIGLFIKELRYLLRDNSKSVQTRQRIEIALRLTVVALSILAIMLMIIWSQSRNTLLTCGIGIVIVFIYLRPAIKATLFVTSGLSALIYIAYLFIYSTPNFWLSQVVTTFFTINIWNRLSNILNQSVRVQIFQCAIDLIGEKPILGWKIGTFAVECEERMGRFVNHAHNIFLQLACDIGIPFTLILCGVMTYLTVITIHKLRTHTNLAQRDILFGFALAYWLAVILSIASIAMIQSYRLIFLFWICLSISYSGISSDKNIKV